MISLLSLLVALLAVFFGPLIAWGIAHQGYAIASRESWMREFRDNVASLLSAYDAFVIFTQTYSSADPAQQPGLARVTDAQRLPYHKIRLLIAAHDPSHLDFIQTIESLLQSPSDQGASRRNLVVDSATKILLQEQALVAEAPGIWPALMNAIKR